METRLMNATEIAEQLGTSKARIYKIIRRLNARLAKKGVPDRSRKVSTGQVVILEKVASEGGEDDEGCCRILKSAFIVFVAFIDGTVQMFSEKSFDPDSKTNSLRAVLRF